MPLFAILDLLVVIYFGVHVIRTGKPMYWLFLLLFFQGLAALVYFIAVYLPEMRHSSGARRATQAVSRMVDPGRDLRDAQFAFDRTPTVDNRRRLADQLSSLGRHDEALSHYEACVAGPYARDSALRLSLARGQLAAGRHADAAATFESLFADDPAQARGAPSLWLAQALASVDEARAVAAFDRACQQHAVLETHAAYGLYLARIGRDEPARAMLRQVMEDARVSTPHARELNREAIEQARAALQKLGG